MLAEEGNASMDTARFVAQCLGQVHERMLKSLHGLGKSELVWRPAPHANCIAEIVWHAVRVADRLAGPRVGLGLELWERDRWFERLGYPREQPPAIDYQLFSRLSLPVPSLEDLLAYKQAVHLDTLDKLRRLSPDDFDRAPDPAQPERTVATYFRHQVTHQNNHHGQVDYIRGLMQPGWDLPPGTGLVQT
jgi:DinB family protein